VTAEAYLRIPQKVRDVVDALLKEEAPGPMLSPHAEYHERTSGIRPQVYVVLWWPWKECEAAAWLKEAGFKHSTPDCGMAEVNASYQAWAWYEPIKTGPRTFRLPRQGAFDAGEGVQFNNGTVVISWLHGGETRFSCLGAAQRALGSDVIFTWDD
jgi:hypothetical protein